MRTNQKETNLIPRPGSKCQVSAYVTHKSPLPRMHVCSQSFRNVIYLIHTTPQYFLINTNFLKCLEQCHFSISQAVHLYLRNKDVSAAASILLHLSHICTAERSQERQHGAHKQGEPPQIKRLKISSLRCMLGWLYVGKNRNIYGKSKLLCKCVVHSVYITQTKIYWSRGVGVSNKQGERH